MTTSTTRASATELRDPANRGRPVASASGRSGILDGHLGLESVYIRNGDQRFCVAIGGVRFTDTNPKRT